MINEELDCFEMRVVQREDGSLDLELVAYDDLHENVIEHSSLDNAISVLAPEDKNLADKFRWIGKQVMAAFVTGQNANTLAWGKS